MSFRTVAPRTDAAVLADLGHIRFKPLQQQAHTMLVSVISQHRTNAVPNMDNCASLIVLPTASGKDLLPFSTARAFSGTSICLHPFKHLTGAAAEYGRQFNCSTQVFTKHLTADCCDVIVAAYEQATSSLIDFVQRLYGNGRLVAIFFNEIHVALQHIDGNFRDFVLARHFALKLRHACGHPMVIVAVTATLQTSHYGLLADTLGLSGWSCGLCTSPFRQNLKFKLRIEKSRTALLQATIDIAIAAADRIIIFVPSKFWCRTLCDIFALSDKPVCIFHSDLTDEEKLDSLSAFELRSNAVLVSTTALSCGMNISGVSRVIVFASVFSTENLLQSGGRAARYGEAGEVVFLTTHYFLCQMQSSGKLGSRQVAALARSPLGFEAALEQLYTQ